MLQDTKHITQEGVRLFVGNIKAGLRKAYNILAHKPRRHLSNFSGDNRYISANQYDNYGDSNNNNRINRDLQQFKNGIMHMFDNFESKIR